MIATMVFDYLEPYLPYQIVSAISLMVFLVEKFLVPRVYDIYSNASLDPKTLLPFVFSAIALYLSLVSIYHAFKAAFRMVWFLAKWSIVIAFVWFILGFLNEMGHDSNGMRTGKNVFQRYSNSASSWWNPKAWSAVNINHPMFLEPMQMIFGTGLMSFFDPSTIFEPMLRHFQSKNPQGSSGQQNHKFSGSSHSSSQYRHPNQHNHGENPRTSNSNEEDAKAHILEGFRQFWAQKVQYPLQSVLQEANRRSQKTKSSSESYTRSQNR